MHPEISKAASAAKEAKFDKQETRKNNSYEDSVLKGGGKSRTGCWGTLKKRKKQRPSTDMKLPQDAITQKGLDLPVEDTSGDAATEQWIKTDEECKCTCIIIEIYYTTFVSQYMHHFFFSGCFTIRAPFPLLGVSQYILSCKT